jgi:hypothetical protein
LIDHGAALYFHHGSAAWSERSGDPFPQVEDHVLLPFATAIEKVDEEAAARLAPQVLRDIMALVPDEWIEGPAQRNAYMEYLTRRLQKPRAFVGEAIRARSQHL